MIAVPVPATVAEGNRDPLLLGNLLNDLPVLASLLAREVERGAWLDAYLLAAGLNQIVDDYLQPEIYPLDQAVEYLDAQSWPCSWVTGRALAAVATGARAVRRRRPSGERVTHWRRELAAIVDALADAAAGVSSPAGMAYADMLESCRALVRGVEELPPGLRRAVIRPPACFSSFDQQPADLLRLVHDFGERLPRRRPLLVVGVRTSGSYLAPLCGAFLKADGWEQVHLLTVRPECGLTRSERRLVRSVMNRDGFALITDDPPVTGASLARIARQLEKAGAPGESIVLLFQLFGAAPPRALDRYRSVVLPAAEWAINARFGPTAVKRDLGALLGPQTAVLSVQPLPLPAPRRDRAHRRALFRVSLQQRPGASRLEKDVLVEGVGLRWFGTKGLAAAHAVPGFCPRLFGLSDGVVYREWIASEQKVHVEEADGAKLVAAAVAAYASERRHTLPVADDISLRLAGQRPAWDVVSAIASRAFGRAWPLAKVAVVDRVVKRLLRVEQPSVVDGQTDLRYWFFRDSAKRWLVKVQPLGGPSSNLGLSCFDAAFDLAGATARITEPRFAREVRQAYAELGNPRVDEERWLLYELAHLSARQRTHPEEDTELRRACARSFQRYFAEVYLHDVEANSSGPLCALDLDGVLETEHLGTPALTPASARTLRALMLHGYRPLLATGRSLGELEERCRAYGLPGGVAEYGAVTYVAGDRSARESLPGSAAAALARLRRVISETDGVHLDHDYRYGVRAYALDGCGARRGLPAEMVGRCLLRSEGKGIRPILGEGQTDFMAAGVDKGTGLRALVGDLGPGSLRSDGRPLALAVGDTVSDAPLAALAAVACAPAHAPAALRAAGYQRMTKPYQAGLAQAVGLLLGHPPGTCPICRLPVMTRERRLLLSLLAAQENGVWSMAVQGAKLVLGRG
jgi:hydroxymethylpyrimidine pyrophosphatase-like HAD family hydrolase